MCGETCHHHQKFNGWAHQFVIGLSLTIIFSGVTCHPLKFRLKSRPISVGLSVLNFLLTMSRCIAVAVRFSCPSSVTLCALSTSHSSVHRSNNNSSKRKTHIADSHRSSVRYIWFNHVVFAKYRDERHRNSQCTLLPRNPLAQSVVRFNSNNNTI